MKHLYIPVLLILSLTGICSNPTFNNGSNLVFIPNAGQIVNDANQPANMVHFRAGVNGLEFYLTDNGLSYVFVKHNRDNYDPALGGSPTEGFETSTDFARVDMLLKNATIDKNTVVKENPAASKYNFYYTHCPDGVIELEGYHKITYKNVYPNIDWIIFSEDGNKLKYEFIVHPGGNPADIKIEYKWADIEVSATSISLSTPMGEITESGLKAYIKETSTVVDAEFVYSQGIVTVNVDAPVNQTLVIDPPLVWSTYWGGTGAEQPQTLVTSGTGEYVFIAGYTNSTTYPTTNPGLGAYYQGTFAGSYDAFVAKFDTSGVHYWSTYYGGTGAEGSTSYTGISLACGQGTTLWMVGTTNSTNLPLQNAGGAAYYQATLGGAYDFFVVKFSLAGVRQHATYMGGSLDDGGLSHGNGADCDAAGNFYFSGRCLSANFPLVNPGGGAYVDNTQNGSDDLVIVKMSPACQTLWATLYGGSGDDMNYSMDLHVDRPNNKLYVGTCTNSTNIPTLNPGGSHYFDGTANGATDAYFARFSLSGVLEWGTFVGGTGDEWLSMSLSTAPDGDLALITLTGSAAMPCVNPGGTAFFDNTYNGTNDIYICRFESTGQMSWSTFYGSTNNEHCQHNLTVDGAGNIIMMCISDGAALPPVFNPGSPHFYDGVKKAQGDYFLVQFSPTGVMLWGTVWGGSGHDHLFGTVGKCIGVSTHSDIFITGETTSLDLPMLNPGGGAYYKPTNSGGGKEGFVAKFNNDIINNILPVELTAFTCESSVSGMNLFWSTATEKNSDYFTIERTVDAENYEVICQIKGAGNSASANNYHFLDKNAGKGVNYYRLIQTDKNGGSFRVYDLISCDQKTAMNDDVLIKVYSIMGQLIFSTTTNNYKGAIDNSDLTPGVYLVELVSGDKTSSIKHVKAN
jgi:hypothetical protein